MKSPLELPGDGPELTAALRRIAEFETFMRAVEVAETQWVAGGISGDDAMRLVSDAWNKARQ